MGTMIAVLISLAVGLAVGLAVYTGLVSCMLFFERLDRRLDALDHNLLWLDRLIADWPTRRGGL